MTEDMNAVFEKIAKDTEQDELLVAQRGNSARGRVVYDGAGDGVQIIEGEIFAIQGAYVVFDDPAILLKNQHTVWIPAPRVIRLEMDPDL